MVRSQLLGQAGGFFCRQSSHRPQVRELWEVGRDIIQRRHSVSPPGRNFLSVYHKKSRCNTRAYKYVSLIDSSVLSSKLRSVSISLGTNFALRILKQYLVNFDF